MLPITPFNRDTFLHAEIARLIGKWHVQVAFETGTYHGYTTLALSLLCELTYTVEINELHFARACAFFDGIGERGQIISDCGSSQVILEANLAELSGKRTLFYLDAHWGHYWPLLDELKAIAKLDAPPPVIAIHDFKVPGRPDLGFDSYDGQDLELAYIEKSLKAIYGDEGYDFHYNSIAIGAHRGVIFIEPKK